MIKAINLNVDDLAFVILVVPPAVANQITAVGCQAAKTTEAM